MEASRRTTGGPWAWGGAVVLSVAAHLVVALLLAVRWPSPPPAQPAASKVTLFKVGMLGGSAPSAPGGPDPNAARPRDAARAITAGSGLARPPKAAAPAPGARPSGATAVEAPGKDTLSATPDASDDTPPSEPAPEGVGNSPHESARTGPATDAAVGAEAVSESVTATEQALEGRGSGAWGVDGAGPVTAAAVGAGAAWGSGEAARLAPEVASLVHAQLVAAAERCYPTPARRFRQRGTVEVRFCLDEQGRVGDAQLQRSSGSDVLDAAVGACVLPKAAPFPEAARGRCFAVPVRFGVRR